MKRYHKSYGFMFIADLFVAESLWMVWNEVKKINYSIYCNADVIKLYGGVFTFLLGLIVPVIHIVFTLDFLKPELIDRNMMKRFNINWILFLLFGALIILSFFAKALYIHHIEDSGYTYCPEKSYRTTSSKVSVFTNQETECNSR